MMHLCSRPALLPEVSALKERYIRDRIDDQARYHHGRSTHLAAMRAKLIAFFWLCSGLAVARAIFVGIFGTSGLSDGLVHTLSHFLPLVLPCMAGCSLALVSVFDLNRQLARSREMEGFLSAAREQADACENVQALQRAITLTERFLVREIADWYTLSEEPRYG